MVSRPNEERVNPLDATIAFTPEHVAAPTVLGVGGLAMLASHGPASTSHLVGATLRGKWVIERLIGVGGMAFVFEARHRNGHRVAIKCMRPELARQPLLVQRFVREGYVANTIEHPGAVAIQDDDVTDDGSPFLVMELLVGETLGERLRRGPLGLAEATSVMLAILDVIAAAHEKGVVHRDLKPDNLFLTRDGALKVLDFGIARLAQRAPSESETLTGVTVGTIGFMSPEQARGESGSDPRADVWALGATFYTLLTGARLHARANANEALLVAMTTPVAPMASLLPQAPASIHAVLDRALAFSITDRYPNAAAMRDALRHAAGVVERTARTSGPPLASIPPLELSAPEASIPTDWRPASGAGLWLGLGAGAVVLVVALGALVASRHTRAPAVGLVTPPPAAVVPPTPVLSVTVERPAPSASASARPKVQKPRAAPARPATKPSDDLLDQRH
ncbi:MAG: serine/threonine-protein kinase [Labilithrix sp.]